MKDFKETREITKVGSYENFYELSSGSMCCALDQKYGVKPKVGDMLTVHTKGSSFGIIRGMDLNGVPIFYVSDEELEANRLKSIKESEERKQADFIKNQESLDAKYNNLPKFFQERIDKFREANPKFRVDYESYEMFCCEQAVLIADTCKTKEEVSKFQASKWEDQLKQVKGLSDGHSGNTFGCACVLAAVYLECPENLKKVYGALSPLVGSAEYGG